LIDHAHDWALPVYWRFRGSENGTCLFLDLMINNLPKEGSYIEKIAYLLDNLKRNPYF